MGLEWKLNDLVQIGLKLRNHAHTYKAENWFVGVIFDFNQDDHKSFSEFEFFSFFRNQI